MCCSNTSKSLSRLGILWGMCALATLLTAFVSNVWVYTKEPVKLPNADVTTSISFRIGLWRVCPSVKRVNSTIHVPSPACSLIKYSGWEEIKYSDLGVWTSLEFTPSFISRMRASTPFEATSVILVLLGTVFAMVGHCNSDRKTLVACGLFILGGLSLGSGLVIFASVLSEAYMERPQMVSRMTGAHSAYLTASGSKLNDALTPPYDYKYGWSFFAAGAAFIMAELAALLSITAYLRRFPTVEDMVRVMVPGAERKLREHHQHLSSDYLVRHVEGSNSRGGSSHHLHHHSTLPAQHCTSNSTQTKYPLSTTTQNYHTMRTQYDIIHHNTSSNTGGGGGGASNVPLLHHHTNTNICTVNNRKCDNPYSHHHHHHHQKDLLLDHTSHDESVGGGGGPRSNNDMIGCDGPLLLLNKTTPDLCSTSDQANNDYSSNEQVTDSLHVTSSAVIPGLNEQDFGPSLPPPNTTTLTSTPNNYLFAGQTVPIKIKKGSTQSFAGDHHNRYGTLPLSGSTIMHQGILGVCQVSGDSSSSTSSSYCSKSKTLHHKNKKSTIGNTTFSTMDCSSFEQFETSTLQKQQRTNTIGGPGGGGGTGSYNPTSSSAV